MGVLILSVVVILIGISTVFGYKYYKQSRTRKNSRHNEGFQVPAGPLLASSPGPLRGGGERAWYTLFAHAQLPQES